MKFLRNAAVLLLFVLGIFLVGCEKADEAAIDTISLSDTVFLDVCESLAYSQREGDAVVLAGNSTTPPAIFPILLAEYGWSSEVVVALAGNTSASPDIFSALLANHGQNEEVLQALAGNTSASPDIFSALLANHGQNEEVLQALAGNTSAPPEVFSSLAEHAVREDTVSVQKNLLRNPSMPDITLVSLLKGIFSDIQGIESIQSPSELLASLARTQDESINTAIRKYVAGHSWYTEEDIQVGEKFSRARERVAMIPDLPDAFLDELATARSYSYLRDRYPREHVDSHGYADMSPEFLLLMVPGNLREYLAGQRNVSPELQAALALDQDKQVHLALIDNSGTSPEIFSDLVKEEDYEVWDRIVGTPHAPSAALSHIFERLSFKPFGLPYDSLCVALAGHPNMPTDILHSLSRFRTPRSEHFSPEEISREEISRIDLVVRQIHLQVFLNPSTSDTTRASLVEKL